MEKSKLKNEEEAYDIFSINFDRICQEYRISEPVASEIKQLWKLKVVSPHTVLFERGNCFDEIWFVADGAIRSSRIVDGKEWIYSLSVKEHYIGDYRSFLTGKESILSFESITNTILYTVTKEQLESIYAKYPEANEYGRFLAEYATGFINKRILGMQTMTLKERYQALLESFPEVAEKVHQQDIAAYLGAKPQSLSRMKSQLFKKRNTDS